MIKSMFHNSDKELTAAHGIENDLTVNDEQTVIIYHSPPNQNGRMSRLPYSVGRLRMARMLGCRIWGVSTKHKTIEAAIVAAKKLDKESA